MEHFGNSASAAYEVNASTPTSATTILEKRRYAGRRHRLPGVREAATRSTRSPPDFEHAGDRHLQEGRLPEAGHRRQARRTPPTTGSQSEYWQHFDIEAQPEVRRQPASRTCSDLADSLPRALPDTEQLERERPGNFARRRALVPRVPGLVPARAGDRRRSTTSWPSCCSSTGRSARRRTEYERTAYAYRRARQGLGRRLRRGVRAPRERQGRHPGRAHRGAARGDPQLDQVRRHLPQARKGHHRAGRDRRRPVRDEGLRAGTRGRHPPDHPVPDRRAGAAARRLDRGRARLVRAAEIPGRGGRLRTTCCGSHPGTTRRSPGFYDNLAASIYKQGELAGKAEDHKTAAGHFLRIAQAAPNSKIRPTAEYDGASALLKLKDWDRAVEVLQGFRKTFPTHELQGEVTKKIAFAYREAGKLTVAAAEYERIEKESKDGEVRRGALLVSADLYEQAGDTARALEVYRRYVAAFPKPLELALESRYKIATIHKSRKDDERLLSPSCARSRTWTRAPGASAPTAPASSAPPPRSA
ncbi:MAG: tetratricopeptide repeat protein [Desulfobacterales bacterium]|nr:tetratricopeptide repeat protein [Desulfobacterales bacterium]